jgi:hypothetical protein
MRSVARSFPRAAATWLTAAALATVATTAARADWLVTLEGARVETRGPWEVRGRMVVFTQTGGTLSSIRLSEVDLEASRAATDEAAAPPPAPAPAEAPPPPPPPVLKLTNADVGRGEPGLQGRQLLIERLRTAHRFKDVGMAMSLVSLHGTPPEVRDALRQQLEGLMEREIRSIDVVELEGGGKLEEVGEDGVTYRPTVPVTHQMVLDLVPDVENQQQTLTFYVGEQLGQFMIAGARPAGR